MRAAMLWRMDRLDVIDTCTRLAWHADQREWDRLGSVFADEVTLDYTSLNGGEPATLTPAQIVAAWQSVLGGFAATQHLLGNHLVAIDGDTAVCTASFQATHRKAEPYGGSLWTLGGTYRFDLVRTGDGWRITGVVMTATWGDGNRGLMP
ncbi:nuclear transport factor 2 family protein [Nonomuraea antimicrobica]|uniref:Nuclear transport factor 2 family protein n=2 Tax=Nonomuraea antimicrobica TaxID=561173 RepID=A0ABP7D5Z6_9ACTN